MELLNSTHTVNFNNSITLFYSFQAPFTGLMLNVTTNLAKTYTSSFNAPSIGFYRAQCNVGVGPGTPECPFLLKVNINTGPTVTKGRISMIGGSPYSFNSGDWIGIAVTALVSGLDLNDTNLNTATMFQTSGVKIGRASCRERV